MKKFTYLFLFLFLLLNVKSRAQLGCYGAINPSSVLWNNVDSVYGCDGVTYPNDTTANFQNNIAHYTFDPAAGNPNGCHADLTFDFAHNMFVDSSITLSTPLYLWEFEYGPTSINSNPHITAVISGYEHVCLTITDGACISKTCRQSPALAGGSGYGCSASFSYSTAGLLASFNSPFTYSSYYNYYWSFGDGDTLFGVANPQHLYASDGIYYVRFHVNNASGSCNTNAQYLINVSSGTSSASPLYTYLSQTIPNCSNNGTITATPYGGIPPITYMWSDGQTTQTAINLGAGNYTVTLTDDSGHTAIGAAVLYSSCHNVIEGFAYEDANSNCIYDVGELPLTDVFIEAIGDSGFYGCWLTDSTGHYSIDVYNQGTYHISADYSMGGPSNCYFLNPCGVDSVTFVSVGDTSFGNVFGFNTTMDHDLYIFPSWDGANPGFDKHYWLAVGNYSNVTYTDTAVVTFVYDTALQYQYSLPPLPAHDSVAHTLTWHVSNLVPFHIFLNCFFHVPASVSTNYFLQSDFDIQPSTDDCNTTNNHSHFSQEVTGSHDPNSKIVTPEGNITDADSVLIYTIHFQNTGTDTTHFVIVKDTLSQYLDPSMVINLASSAPFDFSISGTGILKWVFNPLFLPDSATNEPGSKGFVMFKIKVKPNLPFGTTINNKASIYFDYNPAVITNFATNSIINGVEELTVNSEQLIVYPNPATEQLTISSKKQIMNTIVIIDVLGREIYSQQANLKSEIINLKSFSSGVYFVKVQLENGSVEVGRFVKE